MMDPELVDFLNRNFSQLNLRLDQLAEETRKNREAIHENREAIHENREAIHENREAIHDNGKAIRRNEEKIRHTNIVVEDLRSKIELVAEGVLAVRERQDMDREDNRKRDREQRTFIEVVYTDLNRRVRTLEGH